jgi:RNA polymerase sigma factor (sigma-70 family)
MVNTQTSWWRRRRVDERPTGELPERATGRDAAADLDLHDALWTALSTLPRRQRAMVVLRYYEDLSEADTADVMGVSVGTVKSATSRALATLRTSSGLQDDARLAFPLQTTTGAMS